MAKKESQKGEQKFLFGEVDHLFNTLHVELTALNDEIETVQKSIDNKKDHKSELMERKANLQKSIDYLKKKGAPFDLKKKVETDLKDKGIEEKK